MQVPWFLSPRPSLDRDAGRRGAVDLDRTEAVLVNGGTILMEGERLAFRSVAEAPPGGLIVYLGRHDGRDISAIGLISPGEPATPPLAFVPLREAFGLLDPGPAGDVEREIAATAVAMITWHARNPRCEECGEPTEVREAGWSRRCVRDNRDHYPRTDPAVIVAITDEADRLLLAHVSYHSSHFFTHLAGFVEPGESLEHAAHREVREEASLAITELTYVGSQPWPFPASVMAAFRARARAEELRVDGVEVTEARWMERAELSAAVATGELRLPPPGTIARHLIHEWYGGDLDAPPHVGPS